MARTVILLSKCGFFYVVPGFLILFNGRYFSLTVLRQMRVPPEQRTWAEKARGFPLGRKKVSSVGKWYHQVTSRSPAE